MMVVVMVVVLVMVASEIESKTADPAIDIF